MYHRPCDNLKTNKLISLECYTKLKIFDTQNDAASQVCLVLLCILESKS